MRENDNFKNGWSHNEIKNIKDVESELHRLILKLKEDLKNREPNYDPREPDPERDPMPVHPMFEEECPWRRLFVYMDKDRVSMNIKCRIGCFLHGFSLKHHFKPLFNWDCDWEERPPYEHDYKRILKLEKMFMFLKQELEERVEATERLQDDSIGKHLRRHLKNDPNVVNIVLEYIPSIKLTNCYIAKEFFSGKCVLVRKSD